MKTLLLLAFVLAVVGAQDGPVLPPPGNPGHVEPPPGARCVHAGPGVSAAQACACVPTCMENRDGNGELDGTERRIEDVVRCRVACHPKHCACLSNCEP